MSGLLFGVVAVVRFATPSATALKEGGRSASDAPGRHRTRNALVVGRVALALTLGALPVLAAAIVLGFAAVAASLMPAARASRVDVLKAIRSE